MYRRALYDKMAVWLIWCVRAFDPNDPAGGWIHVNEGPVLQNRKGGGDYSKLAYWDLIEPRPLEDGDSPERTAGWWRPTPRGIAFVHGQIRLPSHVYLYDHRIQTQAGDRGFSEETITIFDALGKRFSYAEIMEIEPAVAARRLQRLQPDERQLPLFGVPDEEP
jgi:hypothetical protein